MVREAGLALLSLTLDMVNFDSDGSRRAWKMVSSRSIASEDFKIVARRERIAGEPYVATP